MSRAVWILEYLYTSGWTHRMVYSSEEDARFAARNDAGWRVVKYVPAPEPLPLTATAKRNARRAARDAAKRTEVEKQLKAVLEKVGTKEIKLSSDFAENVGRIAAGLEPRKRKVK